MRGGLIQIPCPCFHSQAAESEVSFGSLDGSDVRVGIIRTRWNDEHVSNLVTGCKKALKECNVQEENIFETSVPGSYELPLAARFLALSGTVDAIVCAGVLIKGEVSRNCHLSICREHWCSCLIAFFLSNNLKLRLFTLNTFRKPSLRVL